MWILLSRHVVSKDIEEDEEEERFITVHVYRSAFYLRFLEAFELVFIFNVQGWETHFWVSSFPAC